MAMATIAAMVASARQIARAHREIAPKTP